jgi:hypothetical protein
MEDQVEDQEEYTGPELYEKISEEWTKLADS